MISNYPKKRPTQKHRPAIWTTGLFHEKWAALNDARELGEFSTMAEAAAHAGLKEEGRDPRVAAPNVFPPTRYDDGRHPMAEVLRPRRSQKIVWVRK